MSAKTVCRTQLSTQRILLGLGAVLLYLQASFALALDPVNSTLFGKAIKGYDPVAYFTEGKPVEGNSDFEYEWNGAKWYFASAQNRDSFVDDPERYAPQYGGYCAWAVSQGYTASIDPKAWTVRDDKLYLNYSTGVRSQWLKSVDQNISAGDRNWPELLK